MKFKVVCPKCLRIYEQPIPLVSKENTMRFKCEKCDIVLVRFENTVEVVGSSSND